MVIYFSGTGNSAYAADAIADRLSDDVVNAGTYIKEKKAGIFHSETPWVFVFPIYVSAMAKIFEDFLRQSSFNGSKKAYFVATCASAMGITPNIGAKIAAAKGLEFMGAEKIVMPQNYIALFPMTEPAEIKKRQGNALIAADTIAETIRTGGRLGMKQCSEAEYIMTVGIEKLYNRYFTKTARFFATEKCVGCGLCEKVCPLNNIHLTGGKPQWEDRCVHCMSCINRCPKAAIEYGKGTAPKTRYVCVKYKKQEH